VRVTKILEHPRAGSEQHRHDVKRELVDQAGREELLAGLRSPHHRDALAADLVSRRREGRRVIYTRTAIGDTLGSQSW
jgi:hypothetical protein